MKPDPATINLFAKQSQFQADNLEKVVRLRQVLIESLISVIRPRSP